VAIRLPLLTLALLVSATLASAQSVVVLRLGASSTAFPNPDLDGRITLTLSSGTRITIPATDIDVPQTRTASGLATTPPPLVPSMIDLLLSPIGAEDTLRRKCLDDWRDDARQRATCESRQREALAALKNRTMSFSNDRRAIRSKCALESPGDFRLMNNCEEQQLKAVVR
jgi:hypothetical protein